MDFGDLGIVGIGIMIIAAFTVGYLIAQSSVDGKMKQLNADLKDAKSTAAGLATSVSATTRNSENCQTALQQCQQKAAMKEPLVPN